MVVFQNDLQTFHTADTPEPVVDGLIEVDTHFIGDHLPCQVVVVIGKHDHTVQIKDNSFDVHNFLSIDKGFGV